MDVACFREDGGAEQKGRNQQHQINDVSTHSASMWGAFCSLSDGQHKRESNKSHSIDSAASTNITSSHLPSFMHVFEKRSKETRPVGTHLTVEARASVETQPPPPSLLRKAPTIRRGPGLTAIQGVHLAWWNAASSHRRTPSATRILKPSQAALRRRLFLFLRPRKANKRVLLRFLEARSLLLSPFQHVFCRACLTGSIDGQTSGRGFPHPLSFSLSVPRSLPSDVPATTGAAAAVALRVRWPNLDFIFCPLCLSFHQ